MIGKNFKKIEREIVDKAGEQLLSFFAGRSVGIDIADRSIEVVELEKKSRKYCASHARIELPEGVVRLGRIIKEAELSKALVEVLAMAKPHQIVTKQAVFGIPESQVYSHVFSTEPGLTSAELDRKIRWEVETNVPAPLADQIYTYKLLENRDQKKNNPDSNEVLVLSTSRVVVGEWKDFFQKNGISVLILDFEPIANYRALLGDRKSPTVCVVDIGSEQTIFSIMNFSDLYYSYSRDIAGAAITRQIVVDAGSGENSLSFEQAESLKIKHGLIGLDGGHEMNKAIAKIVLPIVDEIKNALRIGDERCGEKINKVVLTGGSALMPGLGQFISSQINSQASQSDIGYVEVALGVVAKLGNVKLDIKYSEAAGLALRVLEKSLSDKLDINKQLNSGLSGSGGESRVDGVISAKTKNLVEQSQLASQKGERQKKLLLLIIVIGAVIAMGSFWLKHQREGLPINQDVAAKMKHATSTKQ